MASPRELEEKVGKKSPRKPGSIVALMAVFLVVGIALIVTGSKISQQKQIISADVPVPGVPADPDRPNDEPIPPAGGTTVPASGTSPTGGQSQTPPIPPSENPSPTGNQSPTAPTESTQINVPSGWSMVSGAALQGYDLSAFTSKKVVLYSYNDPAYPNRDWATYPATGDSAIRAVAPLGYYLYSTSAQKLDLSPSGNIPTDLTFARGWHIIYWSGVITDKNGLLSAVKLTYSDGTTMTAAQAAQSDQHRVSMKVYVVVDEDSTGAGTIKELSSVDSDSTISKIPAKSYFWLYLHRTQNRVVGISI